MGLGQFCFKNQKDNREYQIHRPSLLTPAANRCILSSRGTLSFLWQGIDLPKCKCLHVALGETIWPVCVPCTAKHTLPLLPLLWLCVSLSHQPGKAASVAPPQRPTCDLMPSIKPSSEMDFHRTHPSQLVRSSAMNHLDRGGPLRRQTLNISPVGSLGSIPVCVSVFVCFSALYAKSWGFSVSQQQHSPDKRVLG